jgi:hypothetical protein
MAAADLDTQLAALPTAAENATAVDSALTRTGFKLASDGLAQVTAWTVNLTGSLSGNVGGIAGTIQTLDGLAAKATGEDPFNASKEQLDAIVIDPNAPVVPKSITSLQFRREVKARGKAAQLKTWLGTASEDVQIYFQFTAELRTTDPEFIEFVTLLGLTAEQVDQFFIAAAQR